MLGTELKVEKACGSEDIGMALESRHLAARNDQQVVEVRSELSQGGIVRRRVVIRDRNEVEMMSSRDFQRSEYRTRHSHTLMGFALAIRMGRVHVQVPALPPRSRVAGRRQKSGKRRISPV